MESDATDNNEFVVSRRVSKSRVRPNESCSEADTVKTLRFEKRD